MSASAFDIEVDELTLARARRGDMAAREKLFRLFNQAAYSIAYRVCQCPDLAQDVTQEAFINAFRRIRQFRGDAPFWGWLRRVVVNQAISTLRRLPNHGTVDIDEYRASHLASHDGDEARICLAMDLEAAFTRLDGLDRTVVWLHDVEGFSHQEIANLFGKSESFSKTRLSRAHARLRAWLDPSIHPEQNSARESPNGVPDSISDPPAQDGCPARLLNLSATLS